MDIIILSIIILGVMGLSFAVILSYLSKIFKKSRDPKLEEIFNALPHLNCGACGYPGCMQYAQAVLYKDAKKNLCRPGGQKVLEKLESISGEKIEPKEEMSAQRFCDGGKKEVGVKFDYKGPKNCKSASLINNGFKSCTFSCLGFGDCVKVCPVSAIVMDSNSLPTINKEKCIACEKCVKECPKNVLHLAPKKSIVHVRCSSTNPPKSVIAGCKVGCIGCKICEKTCKFDAIHVNNNLSNIDYSKCTNCKECIKVCPRKIIRLE